MRRIRSAVIAAALVTTGTVSVLRAQSPSGTPRPASAVTVRRPASYVLRHGLDYLEYPQESGRALAFLREAELRQAELSPAERQDLRRGLERARQGLPGMNLAAGAAAIPPPKMPDPGAIAPAPRPDRPDPEPIQRTSGTQIEPAETKPFPAAASPGLTPSGPTEPPALPPLPGELGAPPEPPPALTERLAEPASPPELPPVAPLPLPGPPVVPAAEVAPPPAPAAEELTLPPLSSDPPAPAGPAPEDSAPRVTVLRPGGGPPSSLTPELQREVQRIAERQDAEFRQFGAEGPPRAPLDDTDTSTNRLELPRAPSPTEARPVVAIPVIPEDFVPMAPRSWGPSRKYWAAAATCHGPLYFQDASLERYGQSAEQAFGPVGRCLSYPLDDPTQSDQRNQILQPFFSIGKFASQIVLLPYNLVVDPPGEAEYDLGYYRPGDRIPTDTHYRPVWGVGPPLQGRHY